MGEEGLNIFFGGDWGIRLSGCNLRFCSVQFFLGGEGLLHGGGRGGFFLFFICLVESLCDRVLFGDLCGVGGNGGRWSFFFRDGIVWVRPKLICVEGCSVWGRPISYWL